MQQNDTKVYICHLVISHLANVFIFLFIYFLLLKNPEVVEIL